MNKKPIGAEAHVSLFQAGPDRSSPKFEPSEIQTSYISTADAAQRLLVKPQTLRKAFALTGHYAGIVPKKNAHSGRLFWAASDVTKAIDGGVYE